ncbi:hypothetical protein PN456_17125, partial [Nodularia spumigena CS-586/05]|nr:hypothetical protein [Nodularia spumigena CS-586/05]
FDFCWRSLRFALTTQKAVSHGPLPRLLSAVEVTPHGPPTPVSMATPRKLSKIKADYYISCCAGADFTPSGVTRR